MALQHDPTTRRILQAVLYEVGAVAFVGPVLGLAFGKPASSTFLAVFVANLGLLAFFFLYAIGYTWAFDRVFGLPQSAVAR